MAIGSNFYNHFLLEKGRGETSHPVQKIKIIQKSKPYYNLCPSTG
jgi:hypothetical protein